MQFLVILLALVIPLSACSRGEHEDVIDAFLKKNLTERRIAILEYPLEMQVELYVAALMRKHPPDLGLASSVARNGEKIVPFLVQRLKTETFDISKMELIEVFERMQNLGTYNVASNAELMHFLEQQVQTIEHPSSKKFANGFLNKIKADGKK